MTVTQGPLVGFGGGWQLEGKRRQPERALVLRGRVKKVQICPPAVGTTCGCAAGVFVRGGGGSEKVSEGRSEDDRKDQHKVAQVLWAGVSASA